GAAVLVLLFVLVGGLVAGLGLVGAGQGTLGERGHGEAEGEEGREARKGHRLLLLGLALVALVALVALAVLAHLDGVGDLELALEGDDELADEGALDAAFGVGPGPGRADGDVGGAALLAVEGHLDLALALGAPGDHAGAVGGLVAAAAERDLHLGLLGLVEVFL